MNTVPLSVPALPATASPLQGLLGPCVRGALFVLLITGVAYPLATTGVAQLLLPHQANGSLIERGGAVVGSALIGQWFEGAATLLLASCASGAVVALGSNQGPTNPALIANVQQRVAAYRQANGLAQDASVPVDAVTASASGLDPHISLANAQLQAARVAWLWHGRSSWCSSTPKGVCSACWASRA